LVKGIIDQVSDTSLAQRDLAPDSDYLAKVKGMNGYLIHQGWVLILLDGATEPISAEDMFMPKLAPARLFHSTVRKAMFLDETFKHSPMPEDAQFLAMELSRGRLKSRTVMGPDARGRKIKYKLPEEPQRRAVLLVSPMRKIPEVDGDKVPLDTATLELMKETGLDTGNGESVEIRTQREFYERARSLINSMDLRTPNSILRHHIEIKDFIRSKWIIHHLKLAEGHHFRCEWYREHVRWGTHLDQLSFAYVMAKRDLERKITNQQSLPLKKTEELSILDKIIEIRSDAQEWHPLISAEGTAIPMHHSEISAEVIPDNLQDLPENQESKVNPDADSEVGSTFYVRIMSDNRMMESRKGWIKTRNALRNAMKKAREEL